MAGPWPAFVALVEQGGFLDSGQICEEPAEGQVVAGLAGGAFEEPGGGEGDHAGERVDSDLLVGPVPHRVERDGVRVFHLFEVLFDTVLGPVRGNDVGWGPVGAVGEQDPFPEDPFLQGVPARLVGLVGEDHIGRGGPGEGDGEALVDPSWPAEPVDVGLDLVTGPSGFASGEPGGELVELTSGFGKRLFETSGLFGVECR